MTAGESHGAAVLALVEGVPAGLPLLASHIDAELARRQQGYGRGRRMAIEQDRVELISGLRAGETLGSPITLLVRNRDWANWEAIMDPAPRPEDDTPEGRRRQVTRVRPGHADLTGLLKYDRADARDILERASARETTAWRRGPSRAVSSLSSGSPSGATSCDSVAWRRSPSRCCRRT